MKTRTHFTFRVDTWTIDGESIVEHVAGVEDYQVALATFTARLRTLAWRPHHHAAGRASDRGQPPPARGVETSNRAGGGTSRRAQWQHAAELLLDGADVAAFSKAVELALFYDAKLDVSKVPAK